VLKLIAGHKLIH